MTPTRISFFRIPTKNDDYNTNWRKKIVAFITRDRAIDDNLNIAYFLFRFLMLIDFDDALGYRLY